MCVCEHEEYYIQCSREGCISKCTEPVLGQVIVETTKKKKTHKSHSGAHSRVATLIQPSFQKKPLSFFGCRAWLGVPTVQPGHAPLRYTVHEKGFVLQLYFPFFFIATSEYSQPQMGTVLLRIAHIFAFQKIDFPTHPPTTCPLLVEKLWS